MIKKILFDLDNTLIKWENDYKYLSIKEAGIDDIELAKKIDYATSIYEQHIDKLTRQSFVDYILSLNLGLTSEQINKIVDNDTNRYKKASKELIDLLEYLSNKYELLVVTNWFCDVQSKRLENTGILKYFKKVYASSEYKSKPNKEIFIAAMENNKPNECIMVGDSIEKDINPAINLGMDAILIGEDKNYKSIKSVLELKEML